MSKTKATTTTVSIAPQKLYPFQFFTLLGLDSYNPDEVADGRRCVYGRNFRLYDPGNTSQRVALSKRKGHIVYSTPVGETVDQQITSTTGGADQSVGLVTWIAQKFTAGASGNLTKIDVRLKNTASGTGPLIVALYTDSSGPSSLLATSSIPSASLTSSYQYLSARFIEAPAVASSTSYWVVCYIQTDGSNSYAWSSTTSATTAMTSADSGNTWSAASFAMNLKTYVSTAGSVLGLHRFYRSAASPIQLFAFGTNIYSVNDSTGAVTSIKSSLSSSATFYDFAPVNDKVYFVNGQDSPQVYDGSTVAAVGGSPPVADNAEVHVNRLFLLQPNTNYVVFSDAGTYETFGATSFLYVPSPKTADPVIRMVSVQGTMYFFTRNTKYLLYGTDLTSFVLKESPSSKGAVSASAICKTEENTYFMSDDYHVYAFDGAKDTRLSSERVASILRNIANFSSIRLYADDKKLYVSYTPTGHTTNHHRLVYDLVFGEWLSDEETYTGYGISWNSQSDTGQFVVSSSRVGALYYGDSGYNDLGKPIKFDWWSKYMSFGAPAAKHRVKRFYVFLQSQSTNQSIDCQVDVDEQNSPASHPVAVQGTGPVWGSFIWGSATWGTTNFIRQRISIPSSNYKHQFRFVQSGVDNKVALEGFVAYVLPKPPK